MLENGPIPDGMQVCHHCDNPPCCNPAHLFLGTNKDNYLDSVAKGRDAVSQGTIPTGTPEHLKARNQEIIRLYMTGNYTLKSIGEAYGLTRSSVGYITRPALKLLK
jgi:DNA-directed RNA polymerase sigma subunit (sigma70/sigma32)